MSTTHENHFDERSMNEPARRRSARPTHSGHLPTKPRTEDVPNEISPTRSVGRVGRIVGCRTGECALSAGRAIQTSGPRIFPHPVHGSRPANLPAQCLPPRPAFSYACQLLWRGRSSRAHRVLSRRSALSARPCRQAISHISSISGKCTASLHRPSTRVSTLLLTLARNALERSTTSEIASSVSLFCYLRVRTRRSS